MINSKSVSISLSADPTILNSASSTHFSPLIDSVLNITGSFDLFSSSE